MGFDISNRIGDSNETPSSFENAKLTIGWLLGAVYHAIATLLSSEASIGPFTGQPAIFQLSL